MATKLASSIVRSFIGSPSLRATSRWCSPASLRASRAAYSTGESAPPPLLSKIKEDLKAAMRSKDTNRLSVLRTVLAATLNASKTDKPIETDAQLVQLLKKSAEKSMEAAEEARKVGRGDLAEKEEAQASILLEYAASSKLKQISLEELQQLIETAREKFTADGHDAGKVRGLLLKEFLQSAGPLAGVAVDKRLVAGMILKVGAKSPSPSPDGKIDPQN
ncbi:Yqey-like protein-domain-containing protein [Cladorrhinum sp. PSN332]|nr:Yqey-like protein-domain-containing protein [Cladorrhinum sp. PSN332]